MNIFLLYVSVAASVGGFLFGFDSGVISGAEKAIQAEFGLSAFWHGFVVSVALKNAAQTVLMWSPAGAHPVCSSGVPHEKRMAAQAMEIERDLFINSMTFGSNLRKIIIFTN